MKELASCRKGQATGTLTGSGRHVAWPPEFKHGGYDMATYRAPENPILRPQDIPPSREDFEVIGVFNAGVARYRDEVVLLLRVAERPKDQPDDAVLCPTYDVEAGTITVKPFARDDSRNDFSDPRLVVVRTSDTCAPGQGRDALGTQGQGDPKRGESRLGTRDALATKETYLTSISHLRLARSRDGVRFEVADAPALGPANAYETFGLEDPRITAWPEPPVTAPRVQVHPPASPQGERPHDPETQSAPPVRGEGVPPLRPEGILPSHFHSGAISPPPLPSAASPDRYHLTYVGVSPLGVTTCLASTRDFQSFDRHGVIFHPDNKDVVLFPARSGGKYSALHRPHSSLFLRNDIWLAESPDLVCWGNHRHLLGTRDGQWDETRIGAGAVPFCTEKGWLEIYHGADRHNRYCLGAVLLDADEPWKILARSPTPIFAPETPYEQAGFFGNVVFSCGLLPEDGLLKLYYGAADTSLCYAEIPLADVYENLNL